jgi:hypothetical protein
MGLRDVRDFRAFKRRVASMDAERLAAAVRGGGLRPFAEEAAMAELAGRVVADEIDERLGARSPVLRVVNRVSVLAAAVTLAVWLALAFGLFG